MTIRYMTQNQTTEQANPRNFTRYAKFLPSVVYLIAAVLILGSIVFPYWVLVLQAPQYPGGLEMRVFVNRMTGDADPSLDEVHEIDGLNHYIGMQSLYNAAKFERSIAVPAVIIMTILLVIAALWRKRYTWLLAVRAITFLIVFLADLGLWMRYYGQNLDPYAPLSSAIQPFVPPVLGEGVIGQFSTVSYVNTGWYMVVVSSVLIIAAFAFQLWSSRRNRELIKRRPGKYSQNWLGDRLNMSERTVQRYLKRENIHSRQLLEEIRIDWNKLNQIPTAYSAKRAGFDMQPYFLQDEQGKRYPPKPEIAKKLLKQKHSVWLMRRSIKMYWYDQEPIPKISLEQKTKFVLTERVSTKPDHPTSSNEVLVPAQSMPVQPNVSVSEVVPFPKNTLKPQQDLEKQPKRSDRFYKNHLPDASDESLAQEVYRATGNLQEVEARQLVDKYGRKAVGQALGRLEYLREKGDLRNPAGFMKVVSRVCWLAINGFDAPRPEYQLPKKLKSRKPTYNPKTDPIWQSEAYRQWRPSFAETPIDIWEMPYLDSVIEF